MIFREFQKVYVAHRGQEPNPSPALANANPGGRFAMTNSRHITESGHWARASSQPIKEDDILKCAIAQSTTSPVTTSFVEPRKSIL
jgi:hypothetical protein